MVKIKEKWPLHSVTGKGLSVKQRQAAIEERLSPVVFERAEADSVQYASGLRLSFSESVDLGLADRSISVRRTAIYATLRLCNHSNETFERFWTEERCNKVLCEKNASVRELITRFLPVFSTENWLRLIGENSLNSSYVLCSAWTKMNEMDEERIKVTNEDLVRCAKFAIKEVIKAPGYVSPLIEQVILMLEKRKLIDTQFLAEVRNFALVQQFYMKWLQYTKQSVAVNLACVLLNACRNILALKESCRNFDEVLDKLDLPTKSCDLKELLVIGRGTKAFSEGAIVRLEKMAEAAELHERFQIGLAAPRSKKNTL